MKDLVLILVKTSNVKRVPVDKINVGPAKNAIILSDDVSDEAGAGHHTTGTATVECIKSTGGCMQNA